MKAQISIETMLVISLIIVFSITSIVWIEGVIRDREHTVEKSIATAIGGKIATVLEEMEQVHTFANITLPESINGHDYSIILSPEFGVITISWDDSFTKSSFTSKNISGMKKGNGTWLLARNQISNIEVIIG